MNELFAERRAALEERRGRVGIVGLGYVGLPLAAAFLEAGHPVQGIDIDGRKVELLRRGESFIDAVASSRIESAVSSGAFLVDASLEAAAGCAAICICVPTPLGAGREPDLSYVEDTVRGIAPHLDPGALVVLVSTTYPGTTAEIVVPILEAAGHRIGETCYLAYSPEREDPGNSAFVTRSLPRVMGADDEGSRQLVEALFSGVVDKLVPVSSTGVAEAAKILENSFRAVNIALVNEMKLILGALGIDVWEVIDASATKPFGFMPFYPGPGLGGHCIPIDPFYLSWRAQQAGCEARFIELAGEVNTHMPRLVIRRCDEALEACGKTLTGSRILVVGIAYKRDVDDPRESPAIEIIGLLDLAGVQLSYHDPYFPRLPDMRAWEDLPALESVPLSREVLAEHDLVLIVTDHSDIDYEALIEHSNLVVDTRGVTRHTATRKAHPEKVVDA